MEKKQIKKVFHLPHIFFYTALSLRDLFNGMQTEVKSTAMFFRITECILVHNSTKLIGKCILFGTTECIQIR